MTGDEFRKQIEEELDLEAADRALVHVIAETLDRAASTKSARDQRADHRLANELIRTLYARLDAGEKAEDKSSAGRALARQRWGTRGLA